MHDHDEMRAILSLQPRERLCKLSTQTLVRQIHAVGLTKITGHSLKRGSILALSRLVADQVLPPDVLGRLAKHQEIAPPVSAMSVRYGADRAAMARIGRTGEATRLLGLPSRATGGASARHA